MNNDSQPELNGMKAWVVRMVKGKPGFWQVEVGQIGTGDIYDLHWQNISSSELDPSMILAIERERKERRRRHELDAAWAEHKKYNYH